MPDVKEILAQSVAKLLETRQDISRLNLSKLMGVADGTLGRIKYGTGNPNVETLQQIAKFFRFDTWQLLVPGFNPLSPPKLANTATTAVDLAPEEVELLTLFRSLNEPERTYLLLNARGYVAGNPIQKGTPPIKSTA